MLKGLGTALITPFTKNGDVDLETLRWHVRRQAGLVDFLVPCGTTGESPTLSADDFYSVVRTTVEASGEVPVIAGTGSNDTKKAVLYTEAAEEAGADAVLAVSPYYNKPSRRGQRDYYEKIADVGLPVILYDIPSRTGMGVPTDLIIKLASEGVIDGVKWASGNQEQLMDLINETPGSFSVLSGDDALTLGLMALGGDGAISVVSNILPIPMLNVIEYCAEGDINKARKSHYKYLPLMRAMFVEANPIPVKTAFHMIYGQSAKTPVSDKPYFRSPMTEMKEENLDILRKVLRDISLIP